MEIATELIVQIDHVSSLASVRPQLTVKAAPSSFVIYVMTVSVNIVQTIQPVTQANVLSQPTHRNQRESAVVQTVMVEPPLTIFAPHAILTVERVTRAVLQTTQTV